MCVFLTVIVLNGPGPQRARWAMHVAWYLAVPHRNNGHCYAVRTCEGSRSTPRQFIVPRYLALSVACRQLSRKMCIIDLNSVIYITAKQMFDAVLCYSLCLSATLTCPLNLTRSSLLVRQLIYRKQLVGRFHSFCRPRRPLGSVEL
jgi:hypothetical protein